MDKKKLYRIIELICTALVSIAGALLLDSCASTTRIITKQAAPGSQSSKISVTQETEQVISVSPRDSLVIFKKK
ncbi:hypothetical protein [Microvirus mar47]|uniref:Uncharacterized protein n=1 Tax=Microvirus mar47 TaxID=2851182 RepID=A0A8F5RCR9_9VIRU|nr:hypothetical protein [Microvirus mar47]